jgi:hypothetical protein
MQAIATTVELLRSWLERLLNELCLVKRFVQNCVRCDLNVSVGSAP